MAPPVPRQEHAAHIAQAAEQQGVGCGAPGCLHLLPGLVLQPVDIVQAGAADYADDRLDRLPRS